MPKVTKVKTNVSTQKSEKGTLNEIRMLLNTFHGKQGHTFTKIYKLYNRITTKKVLIGNGQIQNAVAQSMQWWSKTRKR